MALFEINKDVKITNPEGQITISVDHRSLVGTESYHIIDIPNNETYYDHEWRNEGSVVIGKAAQFIGKHIIIYSKALNLKDDIAIVAVNYNVNGVICYAHENLKKEDATPSIILTVNFKK